MRAPGWMAHRAYWRALGATEIDIGSKWGDLDDRRREAWAAVEHETGRDTRRGDIAA